MVEAEVRRDAEQLKQTVVTEDGLNSGEEDEEQAYEAWKVRELKRVKREREEREKYGGAVYLVVYPSKCSYLEKDVWSSLSYFIIYTPLNVHILDCSYLILHPSKCSSLERDVWSSPCYLLPLLDVHLLREREKYGVVHVISTPLNVHILSEKYGLVHVASYPLKVHLLREKYGAVHVTSKVYIS